MGGRIDQKSPNFPPRVAASLLSLCPFPLHNSTALSWQRVYDDTLDIRYPADAFVTAVLTYYVVIVTSLASLCARVSIVPQILVEVERNVPLYTRRKPPHPLGCAGLDCCVALGTRDLVAPVGQVETRASKRRGARRLGISCCSQVPECKYSGGRRNKKKEETVTFFNWRFLGELVDVPISL